MRGKVGSAFRPLRISRITPAYAGKSPVDNVGVMCYKDHPRLCGEKLTPSTGQNASPGSPPPMRGKDLTAVLAAPRSGITPAYAGKSSAARCKRCRSWDHPRLCGEKQFNAVPPDGCGGSPPPMRGKDFCKPPFQAFLRITPAYAGKRGRRKR